MNTKRESNTSKLAALFGLAILITAIQASAQRRYDPATEATFKGTVEEVMQVPGPRGGAGGTHLTLKTNQGAVDVRLGPTAYMQKQKIDIAKGDQLEIIGSKVKLQGKEVVIARELKKGDKTVTLRDKKGIPEWSGSRKRK